MGNRQRDPWPLVSVMEMVNVYVNTLVQRASSAYSQLSHQDPIYQGLQQAMPCMRNGLRRLKAIKEYVRRRLLGLETPVDLSPLVDSHQATMQV